MDSSENECSLMRRNENRPTVIYFHGLRERSMETDNILATNRSEMKRCLNLRDEDFTSKSERKLDTDTKMCTRGKSSIQITELIVVAISTHIGNAFTFFTHGPLEFREIDFVDKFIAIASM
jgi:hypothetical protein